MNVSSKIFSALLAVIITTSAFAEPPTDVDVAPAGEAPPMAKPTPTPTPVGDVPVVPSVDEPKAQPQAQPQHTATPANPGFTEDQVDAMVEAKFRARHEYIQTTAPLNQVQGLMDQLRIDEAAERNKLMLQLKQTNKNLHNVKTEFYAFKDAQKPINAQVAELVAWHRQVLNQAKPKPASGFAPGLPNHEASPSDPKGQGNPATISGGGNLLMYCMVGLILALALALYLQRRRTA